MLVKNNLSENIPNKKPKMKNINMSIKKLNKDVTNNSATRKKIKTAIAKMNEKVRTL